jgi:hypothetical protein
MPFLPDLQSLLRSPYIYLILGVITLSAAVASTCTGRTWVRFDGWVYRAKEPYAFWWVVATLYLGSILFIGIFWYWVT